MAVVIFALRNRDFDIFRSKNDFAGAQTQFQFAGFVEFRLSLRAVNFFQRGFNFADLLADFLAENAEVRFEIVFDKLFHIIAALDGFYIQLVFDDVDEKLRKRFGGFDKHFSDRLTIFYVRRISCRATQDDDFQNEIHIFFEFGINHFFVGNRIIAKVNAFRCFVVD